MIVKLAFKVNLLINIALKPFGLMMFLDIDANDDFSVVRIVGAQISRRRQSFL